MIAPPRFLHACLRVLYRASLESRLIGYSGADGGLSAADSDRLAHLHDAVHNIPDLLVRWEDVDEEMLQACLRDYDERYPAHALLLPTYLDALVHNGGRG